LLNLLKPVLYRLFFIQIDCLLAHSIWIMYYFRSEKYNSS
jgi:hypothetical protein